MAEWGEVVDITEIRRIGVTGEVENWYRYRITTKGGITFTKTVPEADTTPEKLEPILKERAEQLDKTKEL